MRRAGGVLCAFSAPLLAGFAVSILISSCAALKNPKVSGCLAECAEECLSLDEVRQHLSRPRSAPGGGKIPEWAKTNRIPPDASPMALWFADHLEQDWPQVLAAFTYLGGRPGGTRRTTIPMLQDEWLRLFPSDTGESIGRAARADLFVILVREAQNLKITRLKRSGRCRPTATKSWLGHALRAMDLDNEEYCDAPEDGELAMMPAIRDCLGVKHLEIIRCAMRLEADPLVADMAVATVACRERHCWDGGA